MATRATTGGFEDGQAAEVVVLDAHDAAELVVLLTAEYAHEGSDLILTGADGTQVLIQDYFAQAEPPLLLTEGGARIGAELASRLVGSVAPGQYAQAGEAVGAQAIGTVDTIEGVVTVIRADGTRVELEARAPVFQGDVIETDEEGAINIVFIDDSTFAMDEDGRMVLDEFIFDPATHEGKSAFTVVQGVFSFVSGEIAKTGPDALIVNTPVATIGIRSTEVAVRAGAEGEETIITLLAEEDGAVGEIVITNAAGTQILNIANQTSIVSSNLIAPSVPEIMSSSQLSDLFGTDFDALTSQDFRDSGGDRSERGAGEDELLDARLEEVKEAAIQSGADPDAVAAAEAAFAEALAEGGDPEAAAEAAFQAALLGNIAPAAGRPTFQTSSLGFGIDPNLLGSGPDLPDLPDPASGSGGGGAGGGGEESGGPPPGGGEEGEPPPAGEEPEAEEPPAEETAATEPPIEQPLVEPVSAAPAVEQPPVEPTPEEPTAEQPPVELTPEEPAVEEPPVQEPEEIEGRDGENDEGEEPGNQPQDEITGSDGNDNLVGTQGEDTLLGGAGNDRLRGLSGDDELHGGDDDDDRLAGHRGDDLLTGGGGRDRLYGGRGDDTLEGGEDGDRLHGGRGDDTLEGGAGNDVLVGGRGADVLRGGEGNDRLVADGDDTEIDGGAGYDSLNVRGNDDVSLDLDDANIEAVRTRGGDDTLSYDGETNVHMRAGAGDDTLTGGAGNDYLRGDAGDDVLTGNAGNDRLIGGEGADELRGGEGDDRIHADGDDTAIEGGAGRDRLYVQGNDDMAVDLGAAGIEVVRSGAGDDNFTYSEGDGQNLNVRARAGDDLVEGGAGNDYLRGDAGDDVLTGNAGNDRLIGGRRGCR